VDLAFAELISDSPSELAWAIAHELGHIYQQRTAQRLWNSDVEWDADYWGVLVATVAGYDPYAAAGTLGKLGMATGTANLGTQLWEDMLLSVDAHGSFSTRINNLTVFIQVVCASSPTFQAICSNYKQVVHPHFPALPTVPLVTTKPRASPE
jgi:predicted Zn-dependent protease